MAYVSAIVLAVTCVLIALAAVAGVVLLMWPRPHPEVMDSQPADKENHGVRDPH